MIEILHHPLHTTCYSYHHNSILHTRIATIVPTVLVYEVMQDVYHQLEDYFETISLLQSLADAAASYVAPRQSWS